jgi:hypothetical protein
LATKIWYNQYTKTRLKDDNGRYRSIFVKKTIDKEGGIAEKVKVREAGGWKIDAMLPNNGAYRVILTIVAEGRNCDINGKW